MAKSKARFLAELLGSTGLVKKSKSELAGADEVLDLDTIPLFPIQNCKIRVFRLRGIRLRSEVLYL